MLESRRRRDSFVVASWPRGSPGLERPSDFARLTPKRRLVVVADDAVAGPAVVVVGTYFESGGLAMLDG